MFPSITARLHGHPGLSSAIILSLSSFCLSSSALPSIPCHIPNLSFLPFSLPSTLSLSLTPSLSPSLLSPPSIFLTRSLSLFSLSFSLSLSPVSFSLSPFLSLFPLSLTLSLSLSLSPSPPALSLSLSFSISLFYLSLLCSLSLSLSGALENSWLREREQSPSSTLIFPNAHSKHQAPLFKDVFTQQRVCVCVCVCVRMCVCVYRGCGI